MTQLRKIEDPDSRAIWILKAFAIVSVMAAHVNMIDHSSTFTFWVTSIWDLYGNVGVILFLILSGYLSAGVVKTDIVFWKKKLNTIVVPWLVCGTITCVMSVILGQNFSPVNWFRWVMGFRTWYYYVPIQLLCFALLPLLVCYGWTAWLAIVLNLFLLAFQSVAKYPVYGLFITPYQDLLNWVGFFALGILARRYDLPHRIQNRATVAIAGILLMTSTYAAVKSGIMGYFNLLAVVRELSAAIILWRISFCLSGVKYNRAFIDMGKWSFCIYLLHMQIVQPICSRLGSSASAYLLKPVIAAGIMFLLVRLSKALLKKFPYGSYIQNCVGLR